MLSAADLQEHGLPEGPVMKLVKSLQQQRQEAAGGTSSAQAREAGT